MVGIKRSSFLLGSGASTGERATWRHVLAVLGLCLCLVVILYRPTLASMAAIWLRSDTYAHGLLIAPISVYLVWLKRRAMAELTPAPRPVGVALLAGLGLCWIAATRLEILVGEQLSVMLMIPALVFTLCGARVTRRILFPLGFLIFAVPMGEFLVPNLQDFTAVFTTQALVFSGVPVYLEGRYMSLPTGEFEVAAACSGIRYLIASITFGCLYAYLTLRSGWRRALFVALAAVIPILANGLRAYGIVMLAHLSDMRWAVGVDHIIYGWLFFAVVISVLMLLGRLLRESDNADADVESDSTRNGLVRSTP